MPAIRAVPLNGLRALALWLWKPRATCLWLSRLNVESLIFF
jgi:hypothetical protein